MESKPQIVVFYIDEKNNNALHQILLNPLELKSIEGNITDIFVRKSSDVMVGDTAYRLCKEVDSNDKKNSSKVQE